MLTRKTLTCYHRTMNAGARLFAKWRAKRKVSQWELSKELGIHPGMLSRYESGAGIPGLANALTIETASEGAVPARSWTED